MFLKYRGTHISSNLEQRRSLSSARLIGRSVQAVQFHKQAYAATPLGH